MSVFLHVTMDVKASELGRFNKVMAEAVEILEGEGWSLFSALIQRTGKLNTVIDIWELNDFQHFDDGLQKFIANPRFAGIKKVLDETVLTETIVFAVKAPYAH